MKERPILFSAPMVRAILEGRKTQTRRVVKPQPAFTNDTFSWDNGVNPKSKGYLTFFGSALEDQEKYFSANFLKRIPVACPYGQPGDRLWVRETTEDNCLGSISITRYTADGAISNLEWDYSRKSRPSIHMKREASRITLEIVSVRVERLNSISAYDVISEGVQLTMPEVTVEYGVEAEARACFSELWESINGAGSWEQNPWVWVVEFKRVDQ